MIVEMRNYRFKVGTVPEFLKLYEQEGLAVQQKHLGRLIGYYSTEIGELNRVVHLWGYEDLEDRRRRRAALIADPAWRAFLAKVTPLVETQESTILNPAPFSPVK